MIAGLLAGFAVAVLLTRPRPLLPAAAVRPGAVRPAAVRRGGSTRSAASLARAACAVAGVAAWAVTGGRMGLAVGLGVALLGPRLLARLDDTESDAAELTAVLPLALDLLAACLAGGAVPVDAVSVVAAAFPGPCGSRLQRVASALNLGSTPAEAWTALGSDRDAAGAAARALARAAQGGAPVAAAVQRVAADARRRQHVQAHRRAARAGVLAVLPLGICFLPAFVLLGVVPAVLGLAGPLLAALS